MTIEELIERTERRLEAALEIGEPIWIARLKARRERYAALLEERDQPVQAETDASQSAALDPSQPAFLQNGFGPRGRPRRDPNTPRPKLKLPRRIKVDLADLLAKPASDVDQLIAERMNEDVSAHGSPVADTETKPARQDDDTGADADPYAFRTVVRKSGDEIAMSDEIGQSMAAFEANCGVQRRTRRRQLYRQSA